MTTIGKNCLTGFISLFLWRPLSVRFFTNSVTTPIRRYWGGYYESWQSAVHQAVSEAWASIESDFSSASHAYLVSERRATANSIAKWTWRNTTESSFQTFVELTHLPHQQAKRGKLGGIASGEARLIKTQDKREQAIELSRGGMKQKEIAAMLGVTDRTIRNWLAMHQNEQS